MSTKPKIIHATVRVVTEKDVKREQRRLQAERARFVPEIAARNEIVQGILNELDSIRQRGEQFQELGRVWKAIKAVKSQVNP